MPVRPMRWLLVQTTVTAAVVTVGVTVATQREPAVDSVRVFAAAPGAATKAGSVRIRLTVKVRAQGRSVTEAMTGTFDIRSHAGSLTLTLPAPLTPVEMRQSESTVFAAVAPARLAETRNRHWVSFDAGRLGDEDRLQDPLAYLRLLAGSKGSVRRVGHGTVNGQRTTHYRVRLSADEMLKRMPSLQASPGATAAAGLTIPTDAWINTANQLVKMTLRMDVRGVRVDLEAVYDDYGMPVHVTLPAPADVQQVYDLTQLMHYATTFS